MHTHRHNYGGRAKPTPASFKPPPRRFAVQPEAAEASTPPVRGASFGHSLSRLRTASARPNAATPIQMYPTPAYQKRGKKLNPKQEEQRRRLFERRYRRAEEARRRMEAERQQREAQLQQRRIGAATTIQSHVRGLLARRQLDAQKNAATTIQSHVRGLLARRQLDAQKGAATTIQSHIRGLLARRQLAAQKNAATSIQSHVRGLLAKKELERRIAKRNTVSVLLRGKGIRIPPKHTIGETKKLSGPRGGRFTATQSSERVLKRAQHIISTGQATHVGTTPNDHVFEVPRRSSAGAPRKFHVHRGGGSGTDLDLFEVPSADSNPTPDTGRRAGSHEYPDTDDEEG